jgi:hypothetical protein
MGGRPHSWRRCMLLVSLLVAALAGVPQAAAQGAGASSGTPGVRSSGEDRSGGASNQSGDLPVSLDRIRAGLKRQATDSILKRVEIPPDFRVQIYEQQRIDDMLSKLDFSHLKAPAPAGGLYGYEQQQRLFNPVDRPLAQPYAAFSGGELITVAIENLIARYLGSRVLNGVSEADRARAERAARKEIDKAIADYCAARPDRNDIQLCLSPPLDR